MANRSPHIPRLELRIPVDTTKKYTTILQTGILEERNASTSIGDFLASLPGFTRQYIRERIETIFLNGVPVDDLETILSDPSPVLAISAAMPGLAGAIFRKNSFHAPLRTTAPASLPANVLSTGKVMIRLKMFNVIASEKGGALMHKGCVLPSNSVLRFIGYRPQLFSNLLDLRCDDKPIGLDELDSILRTSKTIFLRIQEDHVST